MGLWDWKGNSLSVFSYCLTGDINMTIEDEGILEELLSVFSYCFTLYTKTCNVSSWGISPDKVWLSVFSYCFRKYDYDWARSSVWRFRLNFQSFLIASGSCTGLGVISGYETIVGLFQSFLIASVVRGNEIRIYDEERRSSFQSFLIASHIYLSKESHRN
mgnify:CR=1 FL=1